MYYEQTISPASAGFGEWQANPINSEGYEDLGDLITEMHQGVGEQGGEMIELSDDTPPSDWAEDIRGRIHDEPDHIFAIRWPDDSVTYTGISVRDGKP